MEPVLIGNSYFNNAITFEIKKRSVKKVTSAKKVTIILMDEKGHSCSAPKNCKLNTTKNPFCCMIVNDKNHDQ